MTRLFRAKEKMRHALAREHETPLGTVQK